MTAEEFVEYVQLQVDTTYGSHIFVANIVSALRRVDGKSEPDFGKPPEPAEAPRSSGPPAGLSTTSGSVPAAAAEGGDALFAEDDLGETS